MRISDWSSDVCSSDLIETAAIEQFVFKKYHRIGTADRCFQQTLGIRRIIGRNNDEARHRGIPRPVILAMLSRHAGSCAIRPAENHGTAHLAARHIICFGRRRSEEHTSELQSLMRISYAVFCLKKKIQLV